MAKTITLTKGLEVTVDDADYLSMVVFKWYALSPNGSPRTYAARWGGSTRTILMHRVLLGEPDGKVWHVNGNGLDNRRENLRVVPRGKGAAA